MNKRCEIADIVAELDSGMTIGIGGWGGRGKPMAIVRELARSELRELTVVSYGGPDVGMLCAAGKLRKLVFGFVSLDVIALEAHFRKARQAGRIEVMELDEGMLALGLRAAAWRLPFLPTRAGLGSDVARRNPELRTVRSPYDDGETLLAMPDLRLDAALLHVNRADARGNCQWLGPDPFFDEWFARAADKTWVSCEELVDSAAFDDPAAALRMPAERALISGVAAAPLGAHPTSCAPRYGIDVDHLRAWSDAAVPDDGWDEYFRRYVAPGEAAYLESIGGAERVLALALPVF